MVSATEKLISEFPEPSAERLDGTPFREKYVYGGGGRRAEEAHAGVDRVYKAYSGEENTPLEERTMCFKEWNALCDAAALDEEGLSERNMKLAYVGSLYYYSDLFDESNDFKKMTKIEFLECLVRAAHSMHKQRLMRGSESDADLNGNGAPGSSVLQGASESLALANAGSTVSALSMDKSVTIAPMPSRDRWDGVEVNIADFVDILGTIAGKRAIQKKRKA